MNFYLVKSVSHTMVMQLLFNQGSATERCLLYFVGGNWWFMEG